MSLDRPNWHDDDDLQLYYELMHKDKSERTDQENWFMSCMYHQEEYYSGLDGDL